MADKKRMTITVKPNAGRSGIEFDSDACAYRAFVRASPEKGKANAELLKLVRKKFGERAAIVSGKASRRKVIELY